MHIQGKIVADVTFCAERTDLKIICSKEQFDLDLPKANRNKTVMNCILIMYLCEEFYYYYCIIFACRSHQGTDTLNHVTPWM